MATTIGTSIVHPEVLNPVSIVVAMGAAIALVFVATRSGIPISSSHAMVGGLLGAGIGALGLSAVILPGTATFTELGIAALGGAVVGAAILGIITVVRKGDVRLGLLLGAVCGGTLVIPVLMLAGVLKITGLLAIVLFILISPVMGTGSAFVFNIIISHVFQHRNQNRVRRIFKPLHIIACLFQAAGHGANDGQHAVGVITALLVSAGILSSFSIPPWVLLSSAIAIGLGTCFRRLGCRRQDGKKDNKDPPVPGIFCSNREQCDSGDGNLVRGSRSHLPMSSAEQLSGSVQHGEEMRSSGKWSGR